MELENTYFIRTSLRCLGVIGLNPLAKKRRTWLVVPIGLLVLVMGVSALLEIIAHFDDHTKFKSFLQFGPFTWVVFFKLAIIYIYKDKFCDLLEKTKQTLANKYNNEVFSKVNQDILRFCEKLQIWIIVFDIIVTLQILILPLIQRNFFLISYNQDFYVRTPYYEIIFGFQSLYAGIIVLLEFGWFGIFCYYIAYVVAEFRMIKILLRECNLDIYNPEEVAKLRNVIHQHDFILTLIKEVNSAFALPLMIQLFVLFLLLCVALFLMVLNGIPPDMNQIVEYGPVIFYAGFNISVLCIIGQILINEAIGVNEILFYKDWVKNGVYDNKTEMLMIVQRTQPGCYISIGGVFKLDLLFYSIILQKAFSIVGCLHTVAANMDDK